MASYLQRLPLYRELGDVSQFLMTAGAHKGLLFDRFFGGYDPDWKLDTKVTKKADGEPSTAHPMAWITARQDVSQKTRKRIDAQVALITALGGVGMTCATDWHFVTGLGESHPLENGFTWHHTLGTPYLPASSIKGMLRGYLEQWCDLFSEEELLEIFGNKREEEPLRAGQIIFFDALPVGCPEVIQDVMTPHMGEWYAQGDKARADDAQKVPADWHSPIPVTFLAVRNARFVFTIAHRSQPNSPLLGRVLVALEEALAFIGAGAKTAAGYGTMTRLSDADPLSFAKLAAKANEAKAAERSKAEMAQLTDSGKSIWSLRLRADDSALTAENRNISGPLRILLKETVEFVAANGTVDEKQQLRELADTIAKKHWNTKIRDNAKLKELLKLLG
ncbi:MAG: type III-B CRISPR module RAMP protein Cmr6 [Corallincola sp.]|nr:type III-B CRISPR module RAMP protein Cmr6 [Corallincola sp.]